MRIIISGYGRMGHEIEKIALERGHSIVGTPDNIEEWSNIRLSADVCDVVIDFSQGNAAPLVINLCLNAGIPVVSGTTGWPTELESARELCRKVNGTFFYSPNFSIGVNIFFKINQKLAKLLSGHDYKAQVNEIHHIHKLDAPSGTAIALANDIIAANSHYTSWKSGESTKANILPVLSERLDEIPGTHIVQWSAEADTIEISHTAHNRKGFATGAVIAAEWIQGKTGVLGMADLLG